MTGDKQHYQGLDRIGVDVVPGDKEEVSRIMRRLRINGDNWTQNYIVRRVLSRWIREYRQGRDPLDVLPAGYAWPERSEEEDAEARHKA